MLESQSNLRCLLILLLKVILHSAIKVPKNGFSSVLALKESSNIANRKGVELMYSKVS